MQEGTGPKGRYSIEDELARGGMGVVYRALDRSTNRTIAMKRLLAAAAENPRVVRLFQREYHTLVQLQHPRIIEVYDYGVDDEGAFYTMELLDGADLRELSPLEPPQACKHLRDVASSLALLHARRLLHRDLSARNVRLTSDGRAKLLDFGALASFGVTGQVVGTPPVVPPEALGGHPLDQRTDLYALGALAYWLLTGRHAYPAQRLHLLPGIWQQGAPRPPSSIAEGVSADLDDLVMSLLQLDPMSRPGSAAEVIERLNVIGGFESEEVLDVGHSYLSNPRIVGREREIARVRQFVERVANGHSASLFIEGEAGIGKTRLVEEGTIEAQLQGALVVRVDAELARGPHATARKLALALIAAAPDIVLDACKPTASTLVIAIPELETHLPGLEPARASTDPSEQRVRLQEAFGKWFQEVAKHKPLVLAIDNVHASDEASLALFTALPRKSARATIGVIATERSGEPVANPHIVSALREAASVISLVGLSHDETITLVRALFGDVDNAGRLGTWLRERTDGNPMQCLTLATQLIVEDHIRYKDGAWVLPSELSKELLPSGMEQVLERRVAGLSAEGRRLAEALSVEEGSVGIEQCAALADMAHEPFFSAFAQLVENGMLVNVGDDYRFSQSALRRHLYDSLDPAQRRTLHKRAGEYLFSRAGGDAFLRIEAGWHLLRAGEESKGAEVLADVGSSLVRTIEGLRFAAPGLEAALDVFERQGRSKWMILNVLDALTSAGWYVDRKYAEKYGERLLDLAMELSGVTLATRLAPVIGAKRAAKVGPLIAAAKHRAAKSRIDVERFKSFSGVFTPIIGGLGILIGVAANSLDAKGARRYLERLRILEAFPERHVVRVMYDYARFYTLSTEGRFREAEPIGLRVLEWFTTDPARRILGRSGAKALSGGLMTGLALYSAMRGSATSLDWARRLEELGLSFYALMATQTRFVYHAQRGEMASTVGYREELELNAIQGGTTWQTSLLIPFVLGSVHVATGEVARLRVVAEELGRVAREIPSIGPLADTFKAAYHYWRGRPGEAINLLSGIVPGFRPGEHAAWPVVHALYVQSLLGAGRTEEAVSVARESVEALDSSEPALQLACALAEARAGHLDQAADRADRVLEEVQHGVPLHRALAHETRARIALAADDADTFGPHFEAMGDLAKGIANPAMVARWKRLESEGEKSLEEGVVTSTRGVPGVSAYASAVQTVLAQKVGQERIATALRMLMEQSNASRGFLYLGGPGELELAAQSPEDASPTVEMTEHLQRLAGAVHAGTEINDGTEALTGTMILSEATGVVPDGLSNDMTVQLLVISQGGHPKVVGAIALDLGAMGEPPSYEVLEAVAQALSNPSAARREDGVFESVTPVTA